MAQDAFEFFIVETIPCLSGFFENKLWRTDVLQQSHREPIVRNAINAMAALHKQSYLRRSSSDGTSYFSEKATAFASEKYAAALSGLRRQIEDGTASLTVVLICTVLFAHFDSLCSSYASSMMHKAKSLEMLKLAMQSQEANIDDELVRTLSQLDLHASLLSAIYVPVILASDSVPLEKTLSTILDANDLVIRWTRRFIRFLRTSIYEQKLGTQVSESNNPRMTSLAFMDAFETIGLLLAEFRQDPGPILSPREVEGLTLLQIRTKTNRILAASYSSDETSYHEFSDDFDDIIKSISQIMHTSNLQKLVFSATFDEGLLHPLDFVATKCRDHTIRHRALELLRQFPSQGVMWHVAAMIRITERIIEFEELEAELPVPFMGLHRKLILNDHVLSFDPINPRSGMLVKFIEWPVSEDGASAEFEEMLWW